jgi:hypothetical protein
MSHVVKGGRHHDLSKLQRRRVAYDRLPDSPPTNGGASKLSYTRPGSRNDHKQL